MLSWSEKKSILGSKLVINSQLFLSICTFWSFVLVLPHAFTPQNSSDSVPTECTCSALTPSPYNHNPNILFYHSQQEQSQLQKVCSLKYRRPGLYCSSSQERACKLGFEKRPQVCSKQHLWSSGHITAQNKTLLGNLLRNDYLITSKMSLCPRGSHWDESGSLLDPCRPQLLGFPPFTTSSPCRVFTDCFRKWEKVICDPSTLMSSGAFSKRFMIHSSIFIDHQGHCGGANKSLIVQSKSETC